MRKRDVPEGIVTAMRSLETPREQLIVLLAAAIVFLLGRALTVVYDGPAILERAFYALAVVCLLGCALVLFIARR